MKTPNLPPEVIVEMKTPNLPPEVIVEMKIPNLPPEVIEGILSWLPAKPLVRFRCLSRYWLTLLTTDRNFIRHNYTRSIYHEGFILQTKLSNQYFRILNGRFDKPIPLEASNFGSSLFMVGFCNGLICLTNDMGSVIYLWNPGTREFKTLPHPQFQRPNTELKFTLAFGGHHIIINEYKVLKIVEISLDSNAEAEAELYSLSKNAWKRLGPFRYRFFFKVTSRANLNGAIHLMASRLTSQLDYELILAFDMIKEEFREILLPEDINRVGIKRIYLRIFRGCLCIVVRYVCGEFEIWVMKECGVEKSWTKLFTFTHPDSNYPIEFMKSGDILFSMHGGMVYLYDFETNNLQNLQIPGADGQYDVKILPYVESLVPLATQNLQDKSMGKGLKIEISRPLSL